MRNAPTKVRKVNTLRRAVVWGYNDRCAGLPYRKEYETWPSHMQQRYEMGREFASHMLLIGAPPVARVDPTPEWWRAYHDSGAKEAHASLVYATPFPERLYGNP